MSLIGEYRLEHVLDGVLSYADWWRLPGVRRVISGNDQQRVEFF